MKIRKHILVSGIVQGVGFRYRAYHIANALGITGWVENRWDERVEMEIQGDRAALAKMIERLHMEPFIHITGMEQEEMPLVEGERSFLIRG